MIKDVYQNKTKNAEVTFEEKLSNLSEAHINEFFGLFKKKEESLPTEIKNTRKHREIVDQLTAREGKLSYYYYEVYLAFKKWLDNHNPNSYLMFEFYEYKYPNLTIKMMNNEKKMVQFLNMKFDKGVVKLDGNNIAIRSFRDFSVRELIQSNWPTFNPEKQPAYLYTQKVAAASVSAGG